MKNGFSPAVVYTISAVLFIWKNLTNLFFARKYSGISIKSILKEVYSNVVIGGTVMSIIPYLVSTMTFSTDWFRFLVVGSVSVLTSFIVVYKWGLSEGMRQIVINKLKVK